ncbi:SpoIIE family protein phosphatase [Streptomyces sp. NBC_00690]|uniref:SpoIIE family protein phosphatase n=1 Tax=Streptomyces sp. NBC_00690 TaxID=2975808 RepID=UPI002E2CB97D|nr:SpoIIE family protein phosphatase [Streptomyces sp. NBC_00690]
MTQDEHSESTPERPGPPYVAVVTADERDIVTGWDEGARLLLGHLPGEALGRAVSDLLGDQVADAAEAGLREGNSWSGTAELLHRDGTVLKILVRAMREVSGPQRTHWLLTPVGKERRPGGLPHEDRTVAEWAFIQSPCVGVVFDSDLLAVRANTGLESAAALTEDQVRGLRPYQVVLAPGAVEIERAMREVLESGERRDIETYVRVPGESREHAWSMSLAPMRDPAGVVRGVCLTAHDRTEHHRARQRLLLVNEAGNRIGSTLDITRTAQELADVAVPAFADYAAVDLLAFIQHGDEPQSDPLTGPVTLHQAASRAADTIPEAVTVANEYITGAGPSPITECLTSGRTGVFGTDDAAYARWNAQSPEWVARVRPIGAHSVMVVPLRARGVTLGIAIFARRGQPEPFAPDDVLLAEEITARAAVCIDNARRYAHERRTAVTLQRSLLPRSLPDQAALEVAARYLPAGGRAGVGGDWFDVIPLSGARVALVAGDVVGHGIQAAATMGRLRSAVRTLADIDLPPDELLTHFDDVVLRLAAEVGTERGVEHGDVGATCLYAVYDPVSLRCSLASAGHPPPVVVYPDGTAEILDMPVGPPLGLGGLPFETAEVTLPEGSILALYTDGLIEARGRDLDVGLDALRRMLTQSARSLEDLCDGVIAELLPTSPEDDMVLLAARTRSLGERQVATWELEADPAMVARARAEVSDLLSAWGLEELGFTAELVVSELVTNAIRYGNPPIQLRLIRDRQLICEVSDASNTSPHLRRARVYDEGGRGLLLVAQLTQRWGTRYTSDGKTIWADISLDTA